jgi:hypothetical protein
MVEQRYDTYLTRFDLPGRIEHGQIEYSVTQHDTERNDTIRNDTN